MRRSGTSFRQSWSIRRRDSPHVEERSPGLPETCAILGFTRHMSESEAALPLEDSPALGNLSEPEPVSAASSAMSIADVPPAEPPTFTDAIDTTDASGDALMVAP